MATLIELVEHGVDVISLFLGKFIIYDIFFNLRDIDSTVISFVNGIPCNLDSEVEHDVLNRVKKPGHCQVGRNLFKQIINHFVLPVDLIIQHFGRDRSAEVFNGFLSLFVVPFCISWIDEVDSLSYEDQVLQLVYVDSAITVPVDEAHPAYGGCLFQFNFIFLSKLDGVSTKSDKGSSEFHPYYFCGCLFLLLMANFLCLI